MYLNQLAKYREQYEVALEWFLSGGKRPLDLFRLKKAVEARGGFQTVCEEKKWAEMDEIWIMVARSCDPY